MIDVILGQLIGDQEYFGKVWPYLNEEYFPSGAPKVLYKAMKKHVDQYNVAPTLVSLEVSVDSTPGINENVHAGSIELLKALKTDKESLDWTVPETEKYIKKVAIELATSRIIEIQTNAEAAEEKRDRRIPDVGAIPEIMQKALAVGFDNSVGHDWLDDFEARWQAYQSKAYKVPFKSNMLNKITKGGVETGTLNVLMAGTNVGKSLGLCSLAADYIQMGLNVLYISMEMSEFVCAKRIDANLLDVTLDDIEDGVMTYQEYKLKMTKWREKANMGKLKIKQYPIGGADCNTFRGLINELKLKKGFKPDVIIVDYLGICASCRIKYTENTYTLNKAIAEELRAVAVEQQVPVWTGVQTNRGGGEKSDMALSDIAESAGITHHCDFILGVIETEEIKQQGNQMIKQLKTRYGNKDIWNTFMMGVRKGNQRWFDVDQPMTQLNNSGSGTSTQAQTVEPQSTRAKLDLLAGDFMGLNGRTLDLSGAKFD